MEEAEVLNDLFVSVSPSKCFSPTAREAEDKVRDWENKELPSVGDQVQEHLKSLRVPRSMGPDEIDMQAPKKMAD